MVDTTNSLTSEDTAIPAIETRGLTKSYNGTTAIRDVSISVAKGEVVGFLGPNGAGKSTTLRILGGLLPADSGTARICGLPVSLYPQEVKRKIGFMAENNPLPEDLRVGEYLRLRGRLKGLGGRTLRRRIDECLELCDLQRKARRRVIGKLSKGFRQRVGLAEAILAKPEIAFLDEPTIGLDPHQILLTRQLIDTLRGAMTFVISSHILAEIEISADKIIIINQGRIVASGTAEDLREEFIPQRTYLATLRGSNEDILQAARRAAPDCQASFDSADGSWKHLTLLTSSTGDLSETLLAVLHHAPGVTLASFQCRKPTLEEIFLAATRRSWDVTQPTPLPTTPPKSDAPPPTHSA